MQRPHRGFRGQSAPRITPAGYRQLQIGYGCYTSGALAELKFRRYVRAELKFRGYVRAELKFRGYVRAELKFRGYVGAELKFRGYFVRIP